MAVGWERCGWVPYGLMTNLTQATSSPAVLGAVMAVAMAGPVGLVVALRERGWTPLRAVRARLSRRR